MVSVLLARAKARLRDAAKPLSEAAIGALTIALLRSTRYFDPDKTADAFGQIARRIGPLLGENKIGRANLTAAFPEKSPAEIESILAGVWDNLGRIGATRCGRIEIPSRTFELFYQLKADNKPALVFTGHLANWELPALAAAAHGIDSAVLYRRPNIASADRAIREVRQVHMGTLIPAGRDAPLRLAEALKAGRHVGMLVDQYLASGVDVTFFGRKTKANPMLARLLRQVECPVHGVRMIRLPGNRFRGEITEELQPGAIPLAGSTCRARRRQSPRWSRAGSANIRSNGCGCTGDGGRLSGHLLFDREPR